MLQRRRWVLSDMSNMLLVFKNIFKLARKNDSFSIAYILYMIQMFSIVLLSPASTVVILSGNQGCSTIVLSTSSPKGLFVFINHASFLFRQEAWTSCTGFRLRSSRLCSE